MIKLKKAPFIGFLLLFSFACALVHAPAYSAQKQSQTKVVVFGTSWCGYCAKTRDYLQSAGIAFTDYDIETSVEGAKKYHALHGKGVPLIVVGKQRIDGFNVEALNEALTQEGLLKRN